MKNSIIKSLLATCVAGITIVCTQKPSVAQVDMNLLTEVATSCQKDVNSSEYYNNKLGLSISRSDIDSYGDNHTNYCIRTRYFYSQILSQFPWLTSAGEMLPGYPGSVAVSELAASTGSSYNMARSIKYANNANSSAFLDCLSTLDTYSEECRKSGALGTLYYAEYQKFDTSVKSNHSSSYKGWVCHSCFVAYNNNPSGRKMLGSFMEWFMALEPSQRKELMFVLGEEKTQANNRLNMKKEAYQAMEEYNAIRERIAREEKEQRRRNLFE